MLTDYTETPSIQMAFAVELADVAGDDAETGLCPEHRRQWLSWLDYQSVEPMRLITIGTRTSDAVSRQTLRYEAWSATVRAQQTLITAICERGCSCS
jgi:hypothetical protein